MKCWTKSLSLIAAAGMVGVGCSTLLNTALDSAARSTGVDADNWELVLLEHGKGAVSELGVE